MHPGHAVRVRKVGAAVCVEHPPGFAGAVIDHDGVGCTVVDGVAEEGDRGGVGVARACNDCPILRWRVYYYEHWGWRGTAHVITTLCIHHELYLKADR